MGRVLVLNDLEKGSLIQERIRKICPGLEVDLAITCYDISKLLHDCGDQKPSLIITDPFPLEGTEKERREIFSRRMDLVNAQESLVLIYDFRPNGSKTDSYGVNLKGCLYFNEHNNSKRYLRNLITSFGK